MSKECEVYTSKMLKTIEVLKSDFATVRAGRANPSVLDLSLIHIYTLMDYFPKDYLLFVDESHVMLPQVRAMFHGDRARKQQLIDYGFRLPSALDNRPLSFEEFEKRINQVVYVSATPGEYESMRSSQQVEQIIRPTGLLDPEVEVRPIEGQIDDLISEIQLRKPKDQRVLVLSLIHI